MRYLRKSLSIILIITIILIFTFNTSQASAGIIYEASSKETVTSGATLEKITRFTDEGWLNIRVLRVDLSNKYINVDTLSNPDSLTGLTNTKFLAELKGAAAAINASFFNWMPEKGKGYPDGPIVESGKIISASSEYNRYQDSMASFSIDNHDRVAFDYWKTDISLISPGAGQITVGQYNKPSRDYNDFTILDRRWGEYSIGSSPAYPDIVEMVVSGGRVVEIRTAQPAAQIPVNGYVVVTRQAGGEQINSNFEPGDRVELNIASTPDWNKLKMSVTGSAVLIRDGSIPGHFSFNINGRHPRTAIGSSKSGSQLILVTVDGRKDGNIGMTQTELADLMLDLGSYNALCLDGGGSTTMVARKAGSETLEVVNNPSEGYLRGVATAIGVFSIAPPSSLDGLVIDTEDTNMFVNTSREFSIRGYDRYFNPVEVDPGRVRWSVSGVQGSFSGSVFYPKSVGEGKIKAAIGNVTSEMNVSVLSTPVQLELSDRILKLAPGQSKTLTISGKNINGYRAGISPGDINWKVISPIGFMTDGTFKAVSNGAGYVDASIGNVHAYCSVIISPDGKQPAASTIQVPGDTVPLDEANRSVTFKKASDAFRFSVMGQAGEPRNLLEKLLYKRLAEKINGSFDLSAFVGEVTGEASKLLKTPIIATASGYKAIDHKNSRFIQLDSTSHGLRASKTGQWQWLLQQLDTARGDNIFILLPHSPHMFGDKQETGLFQETLTKYRQKTGKNVWVFFKGSSQLSYMERGVKYISTTGLDVPGLAPGNTGTVKYILVNVMGNSVTYEYKPIVD